jgi:cyclic pyranopterin phosphate synthase
LDRQVGTGFSYRIEALFASFCRARAPSKGLAAWTLTVLFAYNKAMSRAAPLVDSFGRTIDYLRVSVTDRCNLRCTYCMSEHMRFVPKAELLSLDELDRVCTAFVRRGVTHLRLTGGEPLVRRDFMTLMRALSRHLASGALQELTLTTNGLRLAPLASGLAEAGIRRINVSLDSLDPAAFARITRGGELTRVLDGIAAAQEAGIRVKINTVALKNGNEQELPEMVRWAHAHALEITLIETMPLGFIEEDRSDQFVSLAEVRRTLESRWTLTPLPDRTAGPARYVRVEETGGKLGFITPLTHNFCDSCRRVRLSCTGNLHMCLGQEISVDLRGALRASPDDHLLDAAIGQAVAAKPRAHDFLMPVRGAAPALSRHMSVTGG